MRNMILRLVLMGVLGTGVVAAEVSVPAIFSDHAVLKRGGRVPVWGKADPGERVKVSLNQNSYEATAGADGRWSVEMDLARSGVGPFEVEVEGTNRIVIKDVLVGEVWLASGQSNMQFTLDRSANVYNAAGLPASPFRTGDFPPVTLKASY